MSDSGLPSTIWGGPLKWEKTTKGARFLVFPARRGDEPLLSLLSFLTLTVLKNGEMLGSTFFK